MFTTLKEKLTHWALNQISSRDPIHMRVAKYRFLLENAIADIRQAASLKDQITCKSILDDAYDKVMLIQTPGFDFHTKITDDSRHIMIDVEMRRTSADATLRLITAVIDVDSMLDFYQIDKVSNRRSKTGSKLPDHHPRFQQEFVNQRLIPLLTRLVAIQSYLDFRNARNDIWFSASPRRHLEILRKFNLDHTTAKHKATTADYLLAAREFSTKTRCLRKFTLECRNPATEELRPAPEFQLLSLDPDDIAEEDIPPCDEHYEFEAFVADYEIDEEPAVEGPVIDLYSIDAIRKIDPRVAASDPTNIVVESESDAKRLNALKQIYVRGQDRAKRRLSPATRENIERFAAIEAAAPHLADLSTRIRRRLILSEKTQTPLYIPPTLLEGPTGNSKTWFCEQLATALDLPIIKQPMNTTSLAEVFVGADMMWRAARQGIVANALLQSDVANPIIFIDEFDKAKPNPHAQDPYSAFLSLLERGNAVSFADEYLKFAMDASHIIWVFTANSVSPFPPEIIDRLAVVKTPAMTMDQKKHILRTRYAERITHYRDWHSKEVTEPVLTRLAEMSLRQAITAIDDVLASAAAHDRRTPIVADFPAPSRDEKHRIGFM